MYICKVMIIEYSIKEETGKEICDKKKKMSSIKKK